MLAVIITLSIFFIFISKRKLGTFRNHYFLFNIWWVLLLLIAQMDSTGLNPPSQYFYYICFFGILSFNASMITAKIRITNIKINSETVKINYKLYFCLQLLTTIFLIPYFFKGLLVSQEENMAVLKASLVDLFENSPFEVIKIYWFCEPIVIASIIISSFMFFFIKKNVMLIIMTIINVLLFSFAFGGRIQMFRMCFILLIFLFFNFLVYGEKKHINKRIKQCFLFIVSFCVIMTIFTQQRSWDDKVSFGKTFNTYFIGSFSLFDKFINNTSISNLDKDYLYGRASLATVIDPFVLLASKTISADLSTKDLGVNKINKVSEKFYTVGKNYEMNAFCTMYYPFMRDFGILGVFIFPFLLGAFLNWLLYKLENSKKSFFFIIYIMFCYIMIFASNRWELVNFWPFGTVVYTFFIFMEMRKKTY